MRGQEPCWLPSALKTAAMIFLSIDADHVSVHLPPPKFTPHSTLQSPFSCHRSAAFLLTAFLLYQGLYTNPPQHDVKQLQPGALLHLALGCYYKADILSVCASVWIWMSSMAASSPPVLLAQREEQACTCVSVHACACSHGTEFVRGRHDLKGERIFRSEESCQAL